LARFREAERRALFRPEDLRLLDDLRAPFRAVPRPPFLADFLARLVDRRALFLALFRVDFLADRFADFFRGLLRAGLVGVGDDSS
jgi:hypothetical protein